MFDLLNGQIDRYEIRERLGTGGMARVYKAWDTNLERLVAIKILHEHLADDPMFKQRFEREAKFIASFNHPNIVQVYDYSVIEREGIPLCYMIMSFIPGKTLRDVLKEAQMNSQRLPLDQVRDIVNDLTAAIGYAHTRGMVHRDVKPGNVILNEHGRAVLTDFGIARMVQSNRLTADGVSTGTPIYMSPEQASGQPGDTRSDLYALGIIVYEILTGRPPFIDDTSLAVMLKHLNTTPPAPSEFIGTDQYNDFIRVALAKAPAHRYQNVEEFAEAFHATFNGRGTERTTMLISALPTTPATTTRVAGTTSVFQTLTQVARENPRTSSAIVFAALGAVVLFGILLVNSTPLRNAQQPAEPTSAPTAIATLPQASADARYFVSTFNESDPSSANWTTSSNEMVTHAFTPDGTYQLRSINPYTAETSIYDASTEYTNLSIGMMARLESDSDPSSGYGIVFRYHDENNYNVFAVDGRGRYSIWARTEGAWVELRGEDEEWTQDESVKPIGESNGLAVSIIGDFISGYVNDTRVVRITDGTLGNGGIGIYFATNEGEAAVTVDSYGVYASVPSMTAGS